METRQECPRARPVHGAQGRPQRGRAASAGRTAQGAVGPGRRLRLLAQQYRSGALDRAAYIAAAQRSTRLWRPQLLRHCIAKQRSVLDSRGDDNMCNPNPSTACRSTPPAPSSPVSAAAAPVMKNAAGRRLSARPVQTLKPPGASSCPPIVKHRDPEPFMRSLPPALARALRLLACGAALCFATPALAAEPCARALSVGWDNWPPYHYLSARQQLEGYSVAMLNEAARRAGRQLHYQQMPWPRTLLRLRTGLVDVAMGALKTPERERYALFVPAYNPATVRLWALREQQARWPVHRPEDLASSARSRWASIAATASAASSTPGCNIRRPR